MIKETECGWSWGGPNDDRLLSVKAATPLIMHVYALIWCNQMSYIKINAHTVVMNWEISQEIRPKPIFVPGCKHFCCKVGRFNVGVYGDYIAFGAIFKWQFQELHFSALSRWLYCSAPEVAAWIKCYTRHNSYWELHYMVKSMRHCCLNMFVNFWSGDVFVVRARLLSPH